MARVKAHYKGVSPREIVVPEWGTPEQPLVIYGKPASVADAARIFEARQKSSFDMYIEAIKLLARDEHGEKLFTNAECIELRRVAIKEVVERVGDLLIRERDGADLMAPLDDLIKN